MIHSLQDIAVSYLVDFDMEVLRWAADPAELESLVIGRLNLKIETVLLSFRYSNWSYPNS